MFFTQDDYKKIQDWLTRNSIKDTEFNEAIEPLNGNETITLVQNGHNVKASLQDFVSQLFLLGVSDFLNVSERFNEKYISLSEAIKLIPFRSRKTGQVITFLDENGEWKIYQFQGERVNQWNSTTLWIDILQAISVTSDIVPDEEDITGIEQGDKTVLKFKDKPYNKDDYSGLGRVYLRKNITTVTNPSTGCKTLVNLLTQEMLGKENTIYIFQYDYDLNGGTINIPEGCILDFQGGKLSNYKSIKAGNNVKILNGTIETDLVAIIELSNNCTIDRCVINYNLYCEVDKGCIFAENKENITIKNCSFGDMQRQELGNCQFIQLKNCNNFLVNGNYCGYTEGECIGIYEGSGIVSNNITDIKGGWSGICTARVTPTEDEVDRDTNDSITISIVNNIVLNSNAAGITINCDNVLCSNNYIRAENLTVYGPGIRMGHLNLPASRCLISNNKIIYKNVTVSSGSTAGVGITFDCGNNNVVEGNYIEGCRIGINNSVTTKGGNIYNNHVVNFTEIGLNIYSNPQAPNYSKKFNVHNNVIESSIENSIGIYVRYTYCDIEGNTVDTDGEGIYITLNEDADCIIRNNKVTSSNKPLRFNTVSTGRLELCGNSFKRNSEELTDQIEASIVPGFKTQIICNNLFDKIGQFKIRQDVCFSNNTIYSNITPIYISNVENIAVTNNTILADDGKSPVYPIWVNITDDSSFVSLKIDSNSSNYKSTINYDGISPYLDKMENGYIGQMETFTYKPIFVCRHRFVYADGRLARSLSGITQDAPTGLNNNDDKGASYFCTDTNKTIFWTGDKWVDAMGTNV